jgi:hypothetical protein
MFLALITEQAEAKRGFSMYLSKLRSLGGGILEIASEDEKCPVTGGGVL